MTANAADELGEALLELLAVVVGAGVLDLGTDGLDPSFDVGLWLATRPRRSIVSSLVMRDVLGGAKIVDGGCSRA